MRKLLLATAAVILLALLGAAATLFVFRDQILLVQARKQLASLPSPTIELDSLRTSLLGPFSVRLEAVKISQPGAAALEAREIELSSPLGVLGLYGAYRSGGEVPLRLLVKDASVSLPEAKAQSKTPSAPWPASLALPFLSPVPIRADIQVEGMEIKGPYSAKGARGKLELRADPSSFEASASLEALASLPGAQAGLPVTLEAKAGGGREAVKLRSFLLRAAGIDATATGDLALAPVSGKLSLSAVAADLSSLPLRPEDRAALGLSAQPRGAFSLKAEASASPAGSLSLEGSVQVEKAVLPLRLPAGTIFSQAMAGGKLEGETLLHASFPFRAEMSWPIGSSPPKVTGGGSFSIDLTQSQVEKAGMLRKPKGVPLRAELRASFREGAAKLEGVRAAFHSLELSGSAELSSPIGKIVSGTFQLRVPSLEGFPEMLPALGQAAAGAALAEAKGEIQASGSARLLLDTPAKSTVELRSLSLKGVRLPLHLKNEKLETSGILLASLVGAGKYTAGELRVDKGEGQADLTGLALSLPSGLEKKKGRRLLLSFDAKGNPARLELRKATLQADGLVARVAGTIASAPGKMQLELKAKASAALDPLREYLPKLPMKITGGNFDADTSLRGTWLTEGGLERSPLFLSGSVKAKIGSIVMPEAKPAEKSAPSPLLPDWPLARQTALAFQLELGQFSRGKLEAKSITAQGKLEQGKLALSASARSFGGSARLERATTSLLEAKLPLRGQVKVEGMSLSSLAGFMDPSYQEIVKGALTADSSFALPDAFASDLVASAEAQGTATVKQGYVSTASLDALVNAKLAGIPGLGDKSKLKTEGLTADMRTAFRFEKGVAALQDFVAVTPKRDEMRLAGTMGLNFDCDLRGEARLTDPPVRGAVREANSDQEGRLVVPIRFQGNLKSPSVDIAGDVVQSLLAKTATHEATKLKDKAVNEGKKKLEDAAKGVLKDLFKR
jgi:hypothetical protein